MKSPQLSIFIKMVKEKLSLKMFPKLINEGNYTAVLNYINKHPKMRTVPRADKMLTSFLSYAICHDRPIESIRAMLDSNVNFNFPTTFDITPLMLAAQSNRLDVLNLLIQRENNVNDIDLRGNTALHHALMEGDNPFIVQALLSAGINTEVKGDSGQTGLEKAIDRERHNCVKVLHSYDLHEKLNIELNIQVQESKPNRKMKI